jgi:thioredoxin-like negative regulator of GroEL
MNSRQKDESPEIFPSINDQNELDQLIGSTSVVLLYFSTPTCSVCQSLKPKLKELLASSFPSVQPRFVDVEQHAEIAARYRVFTVPVIILFAEGWEAIRKSRFINLDEFREETTRLFRLLGD